MAVRCRGRLVAFSLLLPIAVLIGCGPGAEDVDRPGTARAAGPGPVVVDHVYGTTRVEGVPERIVTIDLQWTDTMLALGAEPVGYTVDSYMPDSGVPWQDLPDAEPLDLTDGVPIEEIAALDPDLIVGSFSISDQRTYDLLSEIAPTIPDLGDAEVTPWQDPVTLAGDLLDRPDDAAALVEEVNGEVERTAADLPGLEGQTFSLAQYIVGDAMYIVADENDGSSVFFQQLGMRMHPAVRERGEETGEARIQVSVERADLLRADLLAFLVNGGDERDLSDIPGFSRLPGTVAVLDYPTIIGLNTPSVLSIPYALERLRPYLEAAAA